jgi:Holliday junction resolvase
MGLFDRITKIFAEDPAAARLWAIYSPTQAEYRFSKGSPNDTAKPVQSVLAHHYLNDLVSCGAAAEAGDAYLLPWDTVYALIDDPDHAAGLESLGLPQTSSLKPILRSEGTLDDESFTVAIDGWFDGERSIGAVVLHGPIARVATTEAMLDAETFQLLKTVRSLLAEERCTPALNRQHWGRIRAAATKAGARLDEFLTRTIVLTPDKLSIQLIETAVAETGVVEVQPWFRDAPDCWLSEFDRHNAVPDLYRMLDGGQMVEVVVTPKVQSVLRAIKKMPGRRAAGSLAEKFLSNPFATLGEDASSVIDEKQFEQARDEAGLVFQRFTAYSRLSEKMEVMEAGVLIDTLSESNSSSHRELFQTPDDLQAFVVRVETKLKAGLELCEWRGYRVQMLGETPAELDALKAIYETWTAPRITIHSAEVFDLKRYSERVMGIGVQPAIVSPHIPKPESDPWFPGTDPGNATVVVDIKSDTGPTVQIAVDKKVFVTLKAATEKAIVAGEKFVNVPGIANGVSVKGATAILEELEGRFGQGDGNGGTKGTGGTGKPKLERLELLIRTNVGSTEYLERREAALDFDPNTQPQLPSSLRPEVALKDHQRTGVAWMQHLLTKSPRYCRGAVLADDMGLGKTVQLLTVIARAIEDNPNIEPVLVVAPVSLLENWREEAEKFFQSGALRLLTLYGDALGAMRARTSEIEDDLIRQGFTKFLRDGWLGDAKVVLTTYETLRDLEFSLASVRWSLMICDEAQKIKNPAAMVTRAAKKQNVAFKIACTGTPVENSLADLWCLFDYVQPGLLGALNEFGSKYRRPIECETDEQKERIEELRGIIDPQVLRRLKADVAKDLPSKVIVESARSLPMSKYQRELYSRAIEQYRLRKTPGTESPFANQLGLLHFLRKVCTDPREHGRNFSEEPLSGARERSPKLDWLLTTLADVKRRNQKAIVFCEFRDMQLMLAHYIEEVFSVRPDIINGDTSASASSADSRQKRLKEFQKHAGFGVIVLSPIAVGFGVNIQEANHVIHFTRTWNPAKEDQATDRAYRIGQTRDVFVYYPVVTADEFTTFDVKLNELLEYKRTLSGDMLNGTGDVGPGDFESVVETGGGSFEQRLHIDDADQLTPIYFEAMVAVLWKKRGFKYVELTPSSGDGGVDVVAKTSGVGELVQVKSSRAEDASLGWDAVKELVGGERLYRARFPGVRFGKVAITNRSFNGTAKMQAEVNNVRLVERAELADLLNQHRVVMSEVDRFAESPTQVNA